MPIRLLVDDDQLIALKEAGYSDAEVAEISNKITGNNASANAVSRQLGRLKRTNRVRYSDTLPWKVPAINGHGNSRIAQMLRAQGRRARGKPLPEKTRKALEGWEKYMDEERLVVEYIYIKDADEENGAGFRFQYWQPEDGDSWYRKDPLPLGTPPEPVPFPVDRRSKFDDPVPVQRSPQSVWSGGLFSSTC